MTAPEVTPATIPARAIRQARHTDDGEVLELHDGRLAIVLAPGWGLRSGRGNCRVCRGWTRFMTPDHAQAHPRCIAPFDTYADYQTEQELRALDAEAANVALPTRKD